MMKVFLGDMYVAVEGNPSIPVLLKKRLTYYHRTLKQDQFGRLTPSGITKEVFELVPNHLDTETGTLVERLITLPGFAWRICSLLSDNLMPYKIVDERCRKPDFDAEYACSRLRPYQYEAAWTALNSNGGIIACPTGWGKTHLMGALIKAYNKEQMISASTPLSVVVTPGQDLAEKNYHDLVEILPDRDVGLVHGSKKKYSNDVQVVTPESVGHINLEEAGLMIYDEVHTLTDSRIMKVSPAERAIRFGLSATPTGRFDNADILVEGMFGPVVYRRSYQQAVEDGAVVPIMVIWLPLPRPNNWPASGYKSKDAAYRNGVYRNSEFHRLVGHINRTLPQEWQVLTIVDKTEHMDNMLDHVEDIVYVHADTSAKSMEAKGWRNVKAIPRKLRKEIYDGVANESITRIVSTGIYRVGVNFPELRVLINAEGMGSEIIAGQLPGRASRNVDGKDIAFMIDFYCPWDEITTEELQSDGTFKTKRGFIARDAGSREEVYNELGFEQIWLEDPHGFYDIIVSKGESL